MPGRSVESDKLSAYYSARAQEYERVYAKPERQADLGVLREWLEGQAAGNSILEVACGTGYWTAIAAKTARQILATDTSQTALEILAAKNLGSTVVLARADAFTLLGANGSFDMGMAHFWLSHVPRKYLQDFLQRFSAVLLKRSKIVMIDNRFVQGSSSPISRTDDEGNTYQRRQLANGDEHEIIKNFFSMRELESILKHIGSRVEVLALDYYWGAVIHIERQ